MYIFFPRLFILFLLSQCAAPEYPHLADVPDYRPPSISIKQAKKEIEELKSERAANTSQ